MRKNQGRIFPADFGYSDTKRGSTEVLYKESSEGKNPKFENSISC